MYIFYFLLNFIKIKKKKLTIIHEIGVINLHLKPISWP